jgi:hypothetical protein
MSRKTKKLDVCDDQTNIDYWTGLGPDWFQRIMECPRGRLEDIFEVSEEPAGSYGGLFVKTVFPRRTQQ